MELLGQRVVTLPGRKKRARIALAVSGCTVSAVSRKPIEAEERGIREPQGLAPPDANT